APVPLPLEVPDLAAGPRVDRPHVIGNRYVGNAVDDERRTLDRTGAGRRQPVAPGKTEVLDVVGVDLGERAEPPAGVVAVVGRPSVRRDLVLADRLSRGRPGKRGN